jgi:O-antigen/teichoic acid export membrane protein
VSAVVDASPVVAAPAPPRLRHQALEMFGANALQRVTGAAGGVVAAHLLGPAGRGTYALEVLFGSGIGLALTCGLQFWVAGRLAVDPTAADVRMVLRRQVRILAPVMTVLAGASACLPSSARAAALVLLAIAASNAISTVAVAIPLGLRRTRTAAVALGAGGAAWIGWLCLAVLLDWRAPAAVALGAAVAQLVTAAVCLRFGARTLPRGAASARSRSHHRKVVRAEVAAGLGEVVLLAAFRVDVALVAVLVGPRAAGLYAVATSVAEGLWVMPDAIANVALPQVAAHARTNVRLIRGAAVGSAALLAVPVLLVRQPLITTVFGSDFGDAATAIPGLLVAVVLLSAWKVDSAALSARGRGAIRLQSAAVALGVLVVGDLLLVPRWGIAGASIACAAAYGSAAVIAARSVSRSDGSLALR